MKRILEALKKSPPQGGTIESPERTKEDTSPFAEGRAFAASWSPEPASGVESEVPAVSNPLWDYFAAHTSGPGIWKWSHYFDVYHEHLQRFIGKPVNLVEIGIFSGGSLPMWTSYLGPQSHVYGIDIQEDCKVYESEQVSVLIGDQENRSFWKEFRASVPRVDILIDDGGHTPEQQRVTLEEMLPHLNAGGVYICEDVHKADNRFGDFAAGLATQLNHYRHMEDTIQRSEITDFQRSIYSVHFYPYLVVIEKRASPLGELIGPRHGTEWQPPQWTEKWMREPSSD
jgi:Methyltransferase domain